MPALLMLLACMPGPAEESFVDEIRVLAIEADPPEVGPGETGELIATVVDPAALAPEILVWTCTDLGDGCLEAAGPVDFWLTLAAPVDEQVSLERTAPMAFASILSEELPALPVTVWALACAPGVCEGMEMAREALSTGVVSVELAAWLAAPQASMADLGFDEASLARRSWWVTSLPAEERNHAPEGLSVSAPEGVAAGETTELTVEATDPDGDVPQAFSYATIGGFGEAQVALEEPSAPLTYWAPEEAGEARLYVVVDDTRGGQALWRGTIAVE